MIGRIVGIIRRPRATFMAVIAAPRWVPLLVGLYLVNVAVNGFLLTTDIGQQALVDQWERTALAFGQPVDAARYARFQELSEQGIWYAALTQLVRGPVASLALATVLFLAFGRHRHEAPAFRQVLAVVVYSTAILTVREVVAAPINYFREAVSSPTTLVQLFPVTNAASPVARLLGLIDLFLLWWLAVLASGLSALYGRRTARVATMLFGVYFGAVVILAASMVIAGGTI